jgi:hypothetical protein
LVHGNAVDTNAQFLTSEYGVNNFLILRVVVFVHLHNQYPTRKLVFKALLILSILFLPLGKPNLTEAECLNDGPIQLRGTMFAFFSTVHLLCEVLVAQKSNQAR